MEKNDIIAIGGLIAGILAIVWAVIYWIGIYKPGSPIWPCYVAIPFIIVGFSISIISLVLKRWIFGISGLICSAVAVVLLITAYITALHL